MRAPAFLWYDFWTLRREFKDVGISGQFMAMRESRSYQGLLESKKKIGGNHAFLLEVINQQF